MPPVMESSRLFAEDEATREWQRSASDDDAPASGFVQPSGAPSTPRSRKPPPPPPRRVAAPGGAPQRALPPARPARPPQESAIFVVPVLPGAGRRALPPPPNHASRRPLPSPPLKSARPLPAPPPSRAAAVPGPQPLPAFALPRTGEFAALATMGASGLPSFALPAAAFANGAGRPTPLPAFSSPFTSPAARAPLPAFQPPPARSALPAFSLREEGPADDASERLFGPDENTRQKPLSAPPSAPPSRSSFHAPLSSAPLSRPSALVFSSPDPAELSTARIVPHPAFAARAAALAARGEATPAGSVVLSVPPTPPAPRMPSPSTLAATDLSVSRPGPTDAHNGEAASEVTINPPPAGVAPNADPLVRFVATAKQVLARRMHPRGPTVQAVVAAVTPVLVILGVFLSGPSTGQLRVNTTAKTDGRVDVFVDGRKVCEAVPCLVEELEPGERTVRVMADGYDPAPAVTVEVQSGAEVVAHVPLGEPERAATRNVQPTAIPTATLGVILPATQRLR